MNLLLHTVTLVSALHGILATCPGQPICGCGANLVDCHSRDLTTVPDFSPPNTQIFKTLRLQHNKITRLNNGTFVGANASELLLNNNSISVIEDRAFAGLENTVTRLDLQNNKLKTLSSAIGSLNKLAFLDVSANDIMEVGLTQDVMRHIGDTLTHFHFGSASVRAWPRTLRHLQALEALNVTGGSYYTIPIEAFHGFDGTLKNLSIQHTGLISVPLAIAELRYLTHLYFDHNHLIKNAGILVPSFPDGVLLKLRYLSLEDDGLTMFPPILKYLPQIQTLVLDGNSLDFVSVAAVHIVDGTNIKSLHMRNCSLSRVPGALGGLSHLTLLDLSLNHIHTLDKNDFLGMGSLLTLLLSDNPLEYIAVDAFQDLSSLELLDLTNSRVKQMPTSIQYLTNLRIMHMPNDRIDCTCDLVWLKKWKDNWNHNFTVAGSCETIVAGIDEYLDIYVKRCPNY